MVTRGVHVMLKVTAGEICNIVQGELAAGKGTAEINGVGTDSRLIMPGMVFIALKGERHDGHDYISAAFDKGAAAAIGEYFPAGIFRGSLNGRVLIKVENTLSALQKLAAYHRNKEFDGPLIAVTGSSGKTTTKNLVAMVLSPVYQVLKTPGNFNNEIGLPLTLLDLEMKHEAVVVEMGMRGRGEIKALCTIARPNIGVITNVGTAHLELLESRSNIAAAKGELLDCLQPGDLAVLNGDDPWCRELSKTCNCRVVFYGVERGDIVATNIVGLGVEGMRFTTVFPGEKMEMTIPVPGLHNVYNALAALAVGYSLGVKPEVMINSFKTWPGESLRQELRPGPNNSLIYNDTYNANPESMEAALEAMAGLPGKKVAVLGDMLELGTDTGSLHRKVGKKVADLGFYRLITVGTLAEEIGAGAVEAGMSPARVLTCSSHTQAVECLRELGPGLVVLFKGSRMAGMEKVLAAWEGGSSNG